ncbi:tyrosine-type recombinase/integrase [Cereibacter sphaeroides]|uniref:tyrosine-type recombinase/integrase n=1 Tax=Cereibacter sphaeroides TaxID=1063 RepID=UPI001F25E1AC|nr:tyrosine-type recombinase/integrase [Cereibacter sphaeroides]MCE6960562.1 tyrosine-type recombinase/integrase [Cereibacter sphaeroides]MCE6972757.1 tyrosine-type recombinase/integrase [Cereibacter sphaeroides]
MTKRRNPFPGVTKVVDRHGKVRWRFRKLGRADVYLPGAYGSAEFRTAYEAALAGAASPAARSNAAYASLSWLIETYLRSPRFKNLSDIRKVSIRRELDWLRGQAGDLPFNKFGAHHVEALMDRKSGPSAANSVKKNLSLLFNFAIKNELCGQTHNPAKFADRMKENPDGYHTWTEAEIQKFLGHHGEGTKARLACLLILNTGAARQDVIRLGWQNVKDGRISYRRGKTEIGAELSILPELAAELRLVPPTQMLFLTHGNGRPYKPETFGNWFKDQCAAAGLPHCSAHGLRKGLATSIADHGGTELEIMSVLAHATPKEGATYTKKANRVRLADSALAKLSGAKPEQKLSNLSDRLDKRASQPAEKKGKS